MISEMTNGELGRRINELSTQLASGFAGVNVRLDRVDGRLDTQGNTIGANAVKIAEQGVSIRTLNRRVFRSGDWGDDWEDDRTPPETALESTPITRRDLVVAVASVAAFVALVEWLPRILLAARTP